MALATYTVKSGDNLTKICDGRCGADVAASIAGSTVNAKINTLVNVNNLPDRNLIYVGQVLKLSSGASSPSSSTSGSSTTATTTATSTQPWKVMTQGAIKINGFGLNSQSADGRDVYVYWEKYEHVDFKEYEVRWEWYVNGHLEWEKSNTDKTYSSAPGIPKEAVYCQVFITPISVNKKDSDGNEIANSPKHKWAYTSLQYQFSENPPSVPPKPDIKLDNDKLTLTASIDGIDAKELGATSIIFNVVQDNSASVSHSPAITIDKDPVLVSKYVAHTFTGLVKPGHIYKVRAKTVNAKNKESGWSDFSNPVGTKPSAPTFLANKCIRVKGTDGTIKAHLEWTSVSNAETYVVEYVTTKSDFELTPGNIQKSDETSRTVIEIPISETGYTYYFRVRAKNGDGESDPSSIVDIPIGNKPAAPSPWSTADSVFEGETMELHWIHNPADKSKQYAMQISFNIGNQGWDTGEEYYNTTDANDDDERIDRFQHPYGEVVSYKGDMYFKMDTNHEYLLDKTILWRVRTKGVIDEFGDWSTSSKIHIYEKPTLALSMTSDLAGTGPLINTLISFPFYIRAKDTLDDHKVQKPVGYYVQIISNDYYVTVDDIGRTKTVNVGDVVYSKYFSTAEELVLEMSANDVDLESSISYTLSCIEDLSSGLTITNQHNFTVNWDEVQYPISANISVDKDSCTALITPYCAELVPAGPGGKNLLKYPYTDTDKTVNGITFTDNGDGSITLNGTATDRAIFVLQDTDGDYTGMYTVSGGINRTVKVSCEAYSQSNSWVKNATVNTNYSETITAENNKLKIFINVASGTKANDLVIYPQLELGYKATEYEPYYDKYEVGELIPNLTLSIYRREYDGTYTEIASDIPNDYTSVTDPHPALDYARYRLVAKDMTTGAISFYDMPGYPVNCSSIILQWDEIWSSFDINTEQVVGSPSWSGSLLKLPYNIKVTDNRKPEVAMVEYAGRKHPVSYYGTQVGETSTWNTDIPADDKETIYALRRLSLWTGDVYVREPSGMGYWANVGVTFNTSYSDLITPITLNITRVEGGV